MEFELPNVKLEISTESRSEIETIKYGIKENSFKFKEVTFNSVCTIHYNHVSITRVFI